MQIRVRFCKDVVKDRIVVFNAIPSVCFILYSRWNRRNIGSICEIDLAFLLWRIEINVSRNKKNENKGLD